MPGALFGLACWRGLPLVQPRPCSLGRQLQQQHWRTAPAQHFPRAAAASSDSCDRQEPQPPLTPSPRLEQRQQEWQARLLQVKAFRRQHGWVPRQRPGPRRPLVDEEAELGRWCAQQRRRRDGSWGEPLSAGETAKLQTIPGWSWGEERTARQPYVRLPWEERRQQVAAFIGQHGRLPRQTASKVEPFLEGEQQLGAWCNTQRRRYKGQGTGALLMATAEQVAALEALPGWVWEEFQVQPWEQRLEKVTAFVAQHGRLPRQVAGKAEPLLEGERRLGVWCLQQRQRFKGKGSGVLLTLEQVAALEALSGWVWEEFQREPWEERLQQLENFVEWHGRLPRQVGSKAEPLVDGEAGLGQWIAKQRQRKKGQSSGGPLTAEQVAALEAFSWWRW